MQATALSRSIFASALVLATCALALFVSTSDARAQGVASIYSAVDGETLPEDQGIEAENYLAPTDFVLDKQGEYFYIAAEGTSQIRRVKADGSQPAEALQLPFPPFKMRFFPDESRIAVVGGAEKGRLAVVEVAKPAENAEKYESVPMKIVADFPVGYSPSDVVVQKTDEGTERAYVVNRFNGTLVAYDAATGATLQSWNVGREPFCMEPTPDGKKIVVADRITEMKANQSFSCCKVFVLDTTTGELASTELLNGHNLLQDIAIEPSGRFAFITGVQCSYLSITSQVSGGWITENCVLAIDIDKCQLVEIFFLDDAELGSGNPWGIACTEDGEQLIVSIAGTDEVTFLPLQRLLQVIEQRPEWARPGYGAYSYASFSEGEVQLPFRMRVKFGFKGLRQVVARGSDAYILSYFEDAICKASLKLTPPYKFYPNSYVSQERPPRSWDAAEKAKAATPEGEKPKIENDAQAETDAYATLCAQTDLNTFAGTPLKFTRLEDKNPLEGVVIERSFARLAPKPVLTTRRRGEILFHDATACFENWLSCVTCHPDARVDGFNWDLLNDGTGNLKNTKSMLLSHETPPSMISGVRADAETAVRAGFVHILFNSVVEENACAVDDYLSSLKPLPSPHLVDGELNESAKRGKALFESEKIGCSTCHLGPLYTDLRLHRVGSQDPNDFIDKFDTPTLIEVWRTAPYLNTGAYTTIESLLKEGKHGVKDGQFDELSEQEQNDLIEYVLSL